MTEEKKIEEKAAPAAQNNGSEKAPPTLRTLIGEKVGMTRVFTKDGEVKAVTVVKAGPCPIVRVKSVESKDGYGAVLLGYGARREKSLNKPQLGQFKAAGLNPMRWLREVRVADPKPFKVGQVADVTTFAPGDFVDVQARSKGRGFAGVMKRHGFHGLPASHGASDKQRSPGSLTARRSLGKVLSGQRMAGHYGFATTTSQKIEVIQVDEANHLLYLNGPVPGANGSQVCVCETSNNLKRRPAKVAKSTVKRDKMGNIIVEKKPTKKKA